MMYNTESIFFSFYKLNGIVLLIIIVIIIICRKLMS